MDLKGQTVLTGIKPTGTLHFGNYAGALKPAVELGHQVNHQGGKHIMFIADYHAINALKDAPLLKQLTREIACGYLACGLNPAESYFYKQSDVPELFELTTILMAYTPKGFMNKAHAYKAAVDKNLAKGEPNDAGINMGLYTYPVLMAADILAYDTDLVPVGKDQVQHVEIAADIAGAINAHFGRQILKQPKYFTTEATETVPGLDGRKMSKSYNNVIPLFADDATLKKAVMSIKTDCQDINAPKNPDEILLYQILKGIAPAETVAEVKEGLEKGGLGYGTIKKMLLEALINEIGPKREKYNDYLTHYDVVEDMLSSGATRARALVKPVLERAKDAIFARK
ncbi:MAG: tryptophan--tRNA ligase [Alphaproteobacteria bacterium]|nr:tryptophan--tRNA ligase [Alphaproteobacteria bacterium]